MLPKCIPQEFAALATLEGKASDLPRAAVSRAHVLVITARSHALEVLRDNDGDQALACLDSLAKQLDPIEGVLAGNEGPLDDETEERPS